MGLQIRKAEERDLSALHQIYMHEEINPYITIDIMNEKDFEPILKEIFASGEMLVLEDDNEVVGACLLKNLSRRCHHVLQVAIFAVHPSYQGKKYGTHLMHHIIENVKAFRQHIKRIELLLVVDNRVGVKFYQKFGFKIEGTLRNFMKRPEEDAYTDARIMALLLDS